MPVMLIVLIVFVMIILANALGAAFWICAIAGALMGICLAMAKISAGNGKDKK